MIELFIIPIVYILGLIFILALSDRYWGSKFLGNLVRPSVKLVYEGRSWWVKDIARLIFMGVLGTIIIVLVYSILPYPLDTLMNGLAILWIVVFFGIAICTIFRSKVTLPEETRSFE